MPILINNDEQDQISLDEFQSLYLQMKIDPTDQQSLAEAAPLFKKLSNNKDFLPDFIASDMLDAFSGQARNSYSPQVVMLRRLGDDAFLRANFWLSADDDLYKKGGSGTLLYDIPHDHNFNFLTITHFGPGYSSDYYEYDYHSTLGVPGEKVGVQFVGRTTLETDKMMLYRAHVDIHKQIPPESMSVTLNIMDISSRAFYADQYIFDSNVERIENVLNRRCVPVMFRAAAILGDDSHREKLNHIFENHDDSFTKFHAMDAIIAGTTDSLLREKFVRRLTDCGDRVVREWAKTVSFDVHCG